MTPSQIQGYPALRIELDITPRWFNAHAGFHQDAEAIHATIGAHEGAAARLLQDVQIGVTGVRIVLAVPANAGTDGFEAERLMLKSLLDGLDQSNTRRRRVSMARQAEADAIATAKADAEAAQKAAEERMAEAERLNAEAERIEAEEHEKKSSAQPRSRSRRRPR